MWRSLLTLIRIVSVYYCNKNLIGVGSEKVKKENLRNFNLKGPKKSMETGGGSVIKKGFLKENFKGNYKIMLLY